MARKRVTLTDLLNENTYRVIFNQFKLLCMNEYKWTGDLPDGLESRHIERLLFEKGMACFFRAPGMDFMCLECAPNGRMNVNYDPTGYRAFGFGYQTDVSADDCVIIRNNMLELATEPFIIHFANKITEAERTMDVNVKACKTPVIFACDDNDVLSFKRIFQQVDGNVPAIFADRGLKLESVQAFLTGVKFMGNELMQYKGSIESDALTFIGKNNIPVDKKERLITDEAQANDQLIKSFSDLQLEARLQACEDIKKKFGRIINVERVVENSVETEDNDNGIV